MNFGNLIDDTLTILVSPVGNTLLDDIRRKFVLWQFEDLAKNASDDLFSILWFATFNNMLNNVIPDTD